MTEKLRGLFWPRKGFRRSVKYFRMRVLRLTASPHAVAAGVMAGIVSSWTPFVGFHIILALALAYILAGNLIAAALSTAFANPITLPFIFATTWEVGNLILGRTPQHAGEPLHLVSLFEKLEFSQLWGPVLKPMLIGAVPLATLSGAAFYIATYYAVRGHQTRRRTRLTERSIALPLAQPVSDPKPSAVESAL